MKMRVKRDANWMVKRGTFVKPMEKYLGKVITVEPAKVSWGSYEYRSQRGSRNSSNHWYWMKEWLEKPTKYTNEEEI